MTLHRIRSITVEAALTTIELSGVLASVLACRTLGHPRPLEWQRMSHGAVGVCTRCRSTIEPNATTSDRC